MSELYNKYKIAKANGDDVDPHAQYFVLRIDSDPAARQALRCYLDSIAKSDPEFAGQLNNWLTKYE